MRRKKEDIEEKENDAKIKLLLAKKYRYVLYIDKGVNRGGTRGCRPPPKKIGGRSPLNHIMRPENF